MNKINFEVGKTYNIQKVGSTAPSKNTTSLVTGLNPLRVVELFSSVPDSFSLRSGTSTYPDSFNWEGYDVKEVFDEVDYIKHSMHTTLQEALDLGLVKIETLKRVFRDQSKDYYKVGPLLWHGKAGVSLQLYCEKDVSDNPFLRKLVVLWKSSVEMKKDVLEVYPDAWFL